MLVHSLRGRRGACRPIGQHVGALSSFFRIDLLELIEHSKLSLCCAAMASKPFAVARQLCI